MNELLFGAQSGSGELMNHGSQLFGFTRQIYALSNISKLEKTSKTSVCPLFLLRLPGAPWHRKLMNALFPVSEKEETLRCPFSLVFYSFPIRVNLSAKDMLSPKVSKFYFVVQVKMKPLTSVLNCFFFFFTSSLGVATGLHITLSSYLRHQPNTWNNPTRTLNPSDTPTANLTAVLSSGSGPGQLAVITEIMNSTKKSWSKTFCP